MSGSTAAHRARYVALRDARADLVLELLQWPRFPKSRAGLRTLPIAKVLRGQLLEHSLRRGKPEGAALVFGRTSGEPLSHSALVQRAERAWRAAGLRRITPHECRHTFASLMIAAGVNAKALQTFMGHSSITMTMDRYGHLMPGSEDAAAELLDGYLDRAAAAAGG